MCFQQSKIYRIECISWIIKYDRSDMYTALDLSASYGCEISSVALRRENGASFRERERERENVRSVIVRDKSNMYCPKTESATPR